MLTFEDLLDLQVDEAVPPKHKKKNLKKINAPIETTSLF